MEGKIIEAYKIGKLIFELNREEGEYTVFYIAEEATMNFTGETKDKETVNLLNNAKSNIGLKKLIEGILTIDGCPLHKRIKDFEDTFETQHTRNMIEAIIGAMGDDED